jgi:chromosome segregation ATPase
MKLHVIAVDEKIDEVNHENHVLTRQRDSLERLEAQSKAEVSRLAQKIEALRSNSPGTSAEDTEAQVCLHSFANSYVYTYCANLCGFCVWR